MSRMKSVKVCVVTNFIKDEIERFSDAENYTDDDDDDDDDDDGGNDNDCEED